MKLLNSEQQIELQALIAKIAAIDEFDLETTGQLSYWAIELKPKRVRRKNEEKILDGMNEAINYAKENATV